MPIDRVLDVLVTRGIRDRTTYRWQVIPSFFGAGATPPRKVIPYNYRRDIKNARGLCVPLFRSSSGAEPDYIALRSTQAL
jgi:hypothetical protein